MGCLWRSRCRVLIVFMLLNIGSAFADTPQRPKNVQTSLRAKWSGTPLLLEAGELLSNEKKDLFWDFIEIWLNTEKDAVSSRTAKDCLKKILECGRPLLREPLKSLFELSLMLRSASPRLVLYQQLAEESLTSFPLGDENYSDNETEEKLQTEKKIERRKVDPLHGVILKSHGGKCCWVDTGEHLFLDFYELLAWLQDSAEQVGDSFQRPEIFDFDHVYYELSVGSPVAILYGAIGTNCFKEFHVALVKAAKEGKVKYVVRPVLPAGCELNINHCGSVGAGESVNLGGYGVELALKNMEYKAMDDSMNLMILLILVRTQLQGMGQLDPNNPLHLGIAGVTLEDPRTEDLSQEVRGFIFSKILVRKPELASEVMAFRDYLLSSTVSDTLDVWELKDLGHQTVQRIVRASDPLQSMQEINQNFPSVVSSLSRMKLEDSVRDEIMANQRMVPPGKSLMALNGALVNVEDIPQGTLKKLLSTSPPSESSIPRVDFRSSHVHYLNNLEEDAKYKQWRNNLDESIDMIISLYENDFPVRFGIVLYSSKFVTQLENHATKEHSDEDISTMIICLFSYINENYGAEMAYQFLRNVNKLHIESDGDADEALETHHVEGVFVETILSKVKSPPQEILLKLYKDQKLKELSQESSKFVFKLGLSKLQCSFLMNGLIIDPTEEALIDALSDETQRIQEQVYYGQMMSDTDVLAKFLSEAGIQRYNPKIISDSKPRFIPLSMFTLGEESVLNDIVYLHSPGTIDDTKAVTHLLAVDITSRNGMKLLQQGIHYLIEGSKNARVGLLFNANPSPNLFSLLFVKVFEITASLYSHKTNVLDFLDQLCSLYEKNYILSPAMEAESTEAFVDMVCELSKANGLPSKGYRFALPEFPAGEVRKHFTKVQNSLYRVLGLESGVNAVFTNGRVTYPIDKSTFLTADLHLLESIEFKQRTKHIVEIIEEVEWRDVDPDTITSKFISDIVMALSSSMAKRDRNSESARFEILNDQHSAIILNNENSSIHIDAVLDPLSPTSQRLSGILRVLWKYIQPSMRIVLNPVSSLADLPLKSYYRYVVPTMDDFSNTDSAINGPKAFFANMPLSKTLTMNLDVPESWLVEPVIAFHDLDNILLENLGNTRTLQAVFELEALVLTGHFSEKDHDPPRGLQLILGTKTTPHLVDTLVMDNLGYWQMKVSPGVWYLQLAPGRSSELYILKEDSEGNYDKKSSKLITINDFRGKVFHMEVVKKKGKEHEKLLLLDDNAQDNKKGSGLNSNFLKWASGFIGSNKSSKKAEKSPQLEPGGFYLSSGMQSSLCASCQFARYERFMKIMILSVLKNTHRPVKFWFIKNYLSPPFKDLIPHMALEYGFEYELVIFVDADQVVRADMGVLYDMDIRGKPLAYTPFCDNNKEMDGYRFWRQGFWKDHLRGKPYHISALYVVDLKKFRETAAGDNLRVIYETLSKDPNSLANLDQDLPNYAQHTVPIFSLPQEWLWCESWCGNATKYKAKTIDLCNNPMTKEPKLQGARRIVSEWPDLDFEARRFTARILGDDQESESIQPPNQSKDLNSEGSSNEDRESRAEL
ncbi:hypothetical protein JHK82_021205 [Glycine max]|nr:hypothetical protein JHK82_021205 [Glycine max]